MKSAVLALFLITHIGLINGDEVEVTKAGEYMVCKPVAGVYGTIGGKNSTSKTVMPVLQGPAGQPGPPGRTGSPGVAGEPNYHKVEQLVSNQIHPLNARIFKVQKQIEQLKAGGGSSSSGGVRPTQSSQDIKNGADCMKKFKSPINVGTMCYNVVGGEGLLWTYETAESDCGKLDGKLADVNSRELYDKLYDYIDRTFSVVVQAWTGMTYEDDKLLLTDGSEASYAKWSSGYPRKSSISYYSTYTKVYIYIDTASYIRKLYNTRGTTKKSFAICSYDLLGNSTTAAVPTTASGTTPA